MKFVSIDIETTGLYPEIDQILEIGMIVEDTDKNLPYDQLPRYHCYINHERLTGNVFALNMNRDIIKNISEKNREKYNILDEANVADDMFRFLYEHFEPSKREYIKITPAGKNFNAFDKLFLERLPNMRAYIRFANRVIDPAILCVDWTKDKELPTLGECKERCGLGDTVAHTAVEDAMDVINILRFKRGEKV